MCRARAILYGCAVFVCCIIAVPVDALSEGGIGGHPASPDPGIQYSDSWFIYSLDVNESKEDRILLTNTSDKTHTVHLYPVDSAPTGDGNFSLEKEDDPRDGIGAWITLSESYVTLQPGQQKEVSFTIRIPEAASVGEHSGGIILQKAEPLNDVAVGQNSASIVTRIGIRVYQTVPGDIVKKLSVKSFAVKQAQGADGSPMYHVDLSVMSSSNVSLNAEARLVISGWGKTQYFPNSRFKDGLYLDFSDFGNFFKGETLKTEWQLLKGQTVSTNWEWPKPRFGAYTFQATVRYAGVEGIEEVTTDPVTVTVIPWIEIIVLLLLIVGILLVFMVKRMRFGGKKWKEYQVQSGDQLGVLATQSGVSWKKLAKMNRLKEPVVHPGQTILMPPSFVPTIKTPVVAEAPVTQSVVASGPVPSTVEAPRRRRVAPRKTTATRKRAPRKKKASQPENESL